MKKLSLLKLIISMTAFGTIGLFVRLIDAERGFIASVRGIVGALFLVLLVLLLKKKPDLEAIKKNLVLLILSGAAIGVNWILLFESYSYTSIATATLCYYMAPVFVILVSPFLLGEKITLKKGIAVATALIGMLFVSGVLEGNTAGSTDLIGVLLALGAAVFYATVTILNKKMSAISPYDMTIVQLATAGVVVLPYTFIAENNDLAALDPTAILMLLIVGVVHTGICYALYFSSIQELEAQTVAIFSYLDPIVAVAISFFVDGAMSPLAIFGAVLILAALILCEINFGKKKKIDSLENTVDSVDVEQNANSPTPELENQPSTPKE